MVPVGELRTPIIKAEGLTGENGMQLRSTKRRNSRNPAINRAIVEVIEPRVLLTATNTAIVPGAAIENTGPFGTFMAVGFGTGTGSRAFSNWGFVQVPISALNPTYTVNTSGAGGVNSLSISLDNTATTGTFAPIAGDFDAFVLPDNDTSTGGPNPIAASNLIYAGGKSSTNTGLTAMGSNFGTDDANSLNTTSANFAGTFSITSALPAGYSTFTLSSLPATVQSVIASDINTYNAGAGPTNTPISIAIVPSADGHPGFADWEGNSSSGNPKVQLDVNETPANTAEQYSIGASAAANGVSVNETAGQVLVDVVRTGFTGDATTLHYNTTAGTAADGTNYTGTQTGSVSFAASQTTAEISVPIINANSSGTANFTVNLTSDTPTQPGGTASISPSAAATVTIVGNASLTNNVGPVLASSTTAIETSGPFSSNFAAVNGSTSNGTGSFGFLSYEVIQATPAPGSTVSNIQNISLSLYNTDNTPGDNLDGHPGDFNIYYLPTVATPVTPATSSLKFNSTVDGVQGTTGAILLGTFSFQNTLGYDTYSVGNLSSTVQADMAQDMSSQTHSIRLAVAPGSVNFAADWRGLFLGQTPTVALTATLSNNTEQFSIGAAAGANGVTVNENNANNTVLVDVTRSGFTGDAVTLDYNTTAGTAVDGANYTGTQSGTVSFAAGQTTADISIPTHDVGFAGAKTFTVNLTGVVGTASAVSSVASPTSSTVTIVGTASLTNNVSNVPASTVTDIETSGPFATAFAPVNGSIYHGTSSFGFLSYEVVELSPSSTPSVFPAPGSQVNSISNLSLSLYNTATTGNFGGDVGDFNIYLLTSTETTTATSSLKFNTAAVDGVNGAAGATLLGTFSFDNNGPGYDVFTPASISTAVSNTIITDLNSGTAFRLAVAPGSASFAADWSGVFQGQTPLISLSDVIQVNQTEELISFQSPTYSQSETGPVATITLTRSGTNISDTATVNYATSDGSALAGGNYTASSGTATFAAGSATTTFTVPVTDVVPMGGDRFLNLSISSPSTGLSGIVGGTIGVLGAPKTAILTITDASTAATQTLDPTLFDASDVEVNGPFDDTEVKATDVSSKFPSYGVVDFTAPTPAATITGIDGATLTVTNVPAGSIAGPVKFYLVQDSTSNILPSNPQSRNPHFYDTTQGIEGIGTQFGATHLLGSYTLTDVAGGDTINIPLALTVDGERALIAALNNPGGNFRIVMTPENTSVDADFMATTVAFSVKVQEGTVVTNFGDVVNGAAGVDSVFIVQDPNQPGQIDWSVNGGPVSQLPANDPNGLTINGNGGNDVVTLNYSNGNAMPNFLLLNGTFTLNGLTGLAGTNPLAGSSLDIGRSTVFISYSSSDPIAAIQSYLKNGYNAGAWTGTPTALTGVITSAAAQASPTHNTAIGYSDSADGQGVNSVPNTIELTYTLYGDANLDHQVNSADLQILLAFLNRSGSWDQADFNYDGQVNSADLQSLLFTLNTSLGNQTASATNAASTPTVTQSSKTTNSSVGSTTQNNTGTGSKPTSATTLHVRRNTRPKHR
jgi:hypothetical protein